MSAKSVYIGNRQSLAVEQGGQGCHQSHAVCVSVGLQKAEMSRTGMMKPQKSSFRKYTLPNIIAATCACW